MVLVAALLNSQDYKIRILGKVKQSRKSYLPTPPLEQDMTQGHFLSGV